MKCPNCDKGCDDIKVIDSRDTGGGNAVRRRRECSCGHRFTTYEMIESSRMADVDSGVITASINSLLKAARELVSLRVAAAKVKAVEPKRPRGRPRKTASTADEKAVA